MKGVNFITDHKNRRTAVIINIKTIENHQDDVEDLLDVIVAESSKDGPKRSWEDARRLYLHQQLSFSWF